MDWCDMLRYYVTVYINTLYIITHGWQYMHYSENRIVKHDSTYGQHMQNMCMAQRRLCVKVTLDCLR